jgi:hypothetical protein
VAESKRPPAKSGVSAGSGDIAAFLAEARGLAPSANDGRGRLIFALDATMSRQPTWDRALQLQGEMFEEAGKVGGLDIQLVYFRGFNECRASRWVSDAKALRDLMTGIDCRGGNTQIGKLLSHARKETTKRKVNVMVFVGDAQEEVLDDLAAKAGELGLLGVRLFMFQEGRDGLVERGFRELARLTGGAYARFDPNAAGELRQLLTAAAVYAAGGLKALRKSAGAKLLIEQLR